MHQPDKISSTGVLFTSTYQLKTTVVKITFSLNPVDTGRKLNVHKTFRRRPGRP